MDICEAEIGPIVEQFLSRKFLTIQENITNFKEFLLEFNSEATTIYSFLDDLKISLENSEIKYFGEMIEKIRYTLIDITVDNVQVFLSNFKLSLEKFYKNNDLTNYEKNLKIFLDTEVKRYFKNYLGCSSKCPGCKSKCTLESGHVGKHETFQHILNGFKGWRYVESHVICVDFCWEKDFYLNRVKSGEKEYTSFKSYVKECYQDWASNIETNYVQYGKNPENDISIEFRTKIIKAWMNTRKTIINYHSRDKWQILDAEYTQDWLNYEE